MSVRDGEMASAEIRRFGRPLNAAFRGGAVVVTDRGALPRVELAGGATVTLLSPMQEQLWSLQRMWQRDLKSGKFPESDSQWLPEAPESAADDVLSERGTKAETKLEAAPNKLDLKELADAPFPEDMSVPNGSSIALLIEAGGRSVMVGGDAYARVLEESIQRLLKERSLERLPLNLFVLPHGGSRGNLSKRLLELIACDRYVLSTSGDRFRHPARETVARILVYGRPLPEAGLTLIFNYRSEVNSLWADATLQKEHKYQAIYPPGDQPGVRISL